MFSESALKSVIIPNGVTTIERNAFEACKALTSIEIPASVETIGPWAFRDWHKRIRRVFHEMYRIDIY